MKKPVIGVMPLFRSDKGDLWMRMGYLGGILEAGGAPIIFPFTKDEELVDQFCGMCDGFLFTGGQDISPSIYGEDPLPELEEVSEERDSLELLVIKRALELKRPVFGICRGLQFLNAYLGGTLYQDIPSQYGTDILHLQTEPYPVPTHEVRIAPDTPLASLLDTETISVNSFHHQGVKKLADGLVPAAWAPDGIVEAFYRPGSVFFAAVQWHPEMLYENDESSRRLFRAFVNAAKG